MIAANGDPGAQPERTVLAWRRTALSGMLCFALLLHHARTEGGTGLIAAGVAAVGTACLVALAMTRCRDIRAGAVNADPARMALTSIVVAGTAACAAVTTLD